MTTTPALDRAELLDLPEELSTLAPLRRARTLHDVAPEQAASLLARLPAARRSPLRAVAATCSEGVSLLAFLLPSLALLGLIWAAALTPPLPQAPPPPATLELEIVPAP